MLLLPRESKKTFSMSATLLSGKDAAAQLRASLKERVAAIPAGVVPGLAIVQVGGREDSAVYIRMKLKAAAECGIDAQHVQLPR